MRICHVHVACRCKVFIASNTGITRALPVDSQACITHYSSSISVLVSPLLPPLVQADNERRRGTTCPIFLPRPSLVSREQRRVANSKIGCRGGKCPQLLDNFKSLDSGFERNDGGALFVNFPIVVEWNKCMLFFP